MKKFSLAMISLSVLVAFLGSIYVGYVNQPMLGFRFMAPVAIWFIFFSLIYFEMD